MYVAGYNKMTWVQRTHYAIKLALKHNQQPVDSRSLNQYSDDMQYAA